MINRISACNKIKPEFWAIARSNFTSTTGLPSTWPSWLRTLLPILRASKPGRGKTLGRRDAWTLRCCVYLFAPPIFLFKVLRVGACDFRIDSAGIVRSAKSGVVTVPWSDLVAIHEYPAGYLFAKKTGAMPVPYRVLTDVQRLALDHFIGIYRQRSLE
ncbi:YcxB family protein [Duganella phyllosphaerae]|uniref:YcxB family protein n=1 Tax=Duganella phyllosphaerae TaxID=762836 RepID=UPI0008742387|nr:YcxB family protein [Duganella phyllosphaerae]